MTAVQLREWMTFMDLEPFGEDREDLRFGTISQILKNVHRDTRRHPKPFELSDCVVPGGDQFTQQQRPRQTWQEMKMIGLMLTAQSEPNKEP
jgi:hypothetical protein